MIPIRGLRLSSGAVFRLPDPPDLPPPVPPRERWTFDRVETLRRMWAVGATGSEIAATLGCGFTRNAVIGKANRLGLERRLNPVEVRNA